MTLSSHLQSLQTRIAKHLRTNITKQTSIPNTLNQAIEYAVLSTSGKKLRPILVYLTGQALEANIEKLDAPACAVELIHCYSLVHDDLPAMDNDDFRRGKASCHKVFGEANAILVGNALQILAIQVITDSGSLQPNEKLAMIKKLAVQSGAQGMLGGQALDLCLTKQALSETSLAQLYYLKTGALFSACTQFGAIAAGCNDKQILSCLDNYARYLSLAFQIQDDLLDHNHKHSDEPSYLDVVSPSQAQEKITQLYQSAQQSVSPLAENGKVLKEFVSFLLHRSH